MGAEDTTRPTAQRSGGGNFDLIGQYGTRSHGCQILNPEHEILNNIK